MKKLFLILIIFVTGFAVHAQIYNNEWIDYSKTYYKFKVGRTGLYRINESELPAGLINIPAEQFQLWRNGKQVNIYTSITTGVLPADGYIEFWGEQNDGKPDKALYKNPANQLSDMYSLETDTAAYFLTVNSAGANARIADAANDVADNTLSAEPYFMSDYHYEFRDMINKGLGVYYGEDLYSSSYDVGEFWSSNEINVTQSVSNTSPDLYTATSGPAASLNISAACNSYFGANNINVTLNGIPVDGMSNLSLLAFGANIFSNNNIAVSSLGSNAVFSVTDNDNSNPNDRVVVGFIDLKYPHQFNFGGAADFTFSLPASLQGNYIEVSNFNSASTPVLYDLTNDKRYAAVVSGGLFKFALQPSSLDRNLVLVSEDVSNIISVNNFTQRNFINYLSSSLQGNYLIISNKLLGENAGEPVDLFRQYRASAVGGSYSAKIYDIDELVDQFAFGIKKHPLSVKNFIKYARDKFSIKPKFVFLIGKAVAYDQYRYNESSPYDDQLNLVPTFGDPASDNILASDNLDPVPAIPIGRLSVVHPEEIQTYLSKLEEYEKAQQDNVQTVDNKAWMKTVVHVIGADDASTNSELSGYMTNYQNIIQNPSFGGNVYTFNKITTTQVTAADALIGQLFTSGISLLNYFGHGSATQLDYNLDNPSDYNNPGKYPVFMASGCNTGNVYSFDTSRLSLITSLSENFVLTPNRGSIAFLAGSNFGVANFLDPYISGFYQSLAGTGYNQPIGYNIIAGATDLLNDNSLDSVTRYIHAEEFVLNGDPALKINAFAKPDFDVEAPDVIINPPFISVANSSFNVKVYFHNLGKAVNDSVSILIKRTYPDGTSAVIVSKNIAPLFFEDSVSINVPIVASRDKGQNTLTVSIDNLNQFDELSETNNTVSTQFFIYEDELTPVYPYNYAIISKSNQHVFASTANPVLPAAQYVMEMDTTALFNSTFKISKTLNSVGGILEFDPGISYADSIVYYWRVAPVPASGPYIWNNSSFIYIPNSSDGFNQSHLYQHLQSTMQNISLDSTSRQWKFTNSFSAMEITNAIYPYYNEDINFSIQLNHQLVTWSACLGHSIIFNIFDPVTLKPLINQPIPSTTANGTSGSFMGSAADCGSHTGTQFNFEFAYNTVADRDAMSAFLNWIPKGDIVTARLILNTPYDTQTFANTWKNDPLVNGTNLYYSLKNAGFSSLDSFYYPRTWIFVYQKKTPSFKPFFNFTQTVADKIDTTFNISSPDSSGTITSPLFGPAKAWKNVIWNGYSIDAPNNDIASVDVIGVNAAGQQQLLYNLSPAQQNFNIASVSATTYPYIQLKMHNEDDVHLTPYQLRYWRILYDPVPEGALAANILYSFQDTLDVGAPLEPKIAFKNISDVAFADSIKVNLTVYDKNNVATVIPTYNLKKINPGDTATLSYNIDTKNFSGTNTFYLDVNPNNDQPEQYHFNNFLYQSFYVKTDDFNPLLDVTFDGIHILNDDIVSAKPLINIKLKDDSKYLLLNDTSFVTVQLLYPDGTLHRFSYNTDTLRFNPATNGANNQASVDFSPVLPQDGQYILYVTGKDATGNPAGFTQYTVSFEVYNKPMITNMFNYPNPFTTSTAFVFTITGSTIPQNMRIQILTITGKIVREITESELGPLHIGRNITQFKWDGTDQFGQKLANGVYIYHVITNLNGQALGKFPTYDSQGNEVNTDKYFNKGYGKMYLMR